MEVTVSVVDYAWHSVNIKLLLQPEDSTGHMPCRWRHIFIHFRSVLWNCTKETTLPGFGMLWFDEVGISNILSFIKVKEKHGVRYYHDEEIFAILKPIHEVLFNPRGGVYNTIIRGNGTWH